MDEVENCDCRGAERKLFVLGAMIFALLSLYILVYRDIWGSLLELWLNSDTYAHGMLVVPVSIYLLYKNIKNSTSFEFKGSYLLLIIIPVIQFIIFIADIAKVDVLRQFAVVGLFPVIAGSIVGVDYIKKNIFPFGFLFLCVPFGEFLIPHLQDFTANFTVAALSLTGVPVYQEGTLFYLPSGSFEVAKACSGIRYLIATVVIGVLYAYLMYESTVRRIIFVGIAFLLPIIANGLRAYGIVLLAHYSELKIATGIDHVIYGWLFFGVVIFLLMWLGSMFSDGKNTSVIKNSNKNHSMKQVKLISNQPFWVIAISAIFFVAVPKILSAKYNIDVHAPDIKINVPDITRSGWKTINRDKFVYSPVYKNAEKQLKKVYRKGNNEIFLSIALFSRKNNGEFISNRNRLYNKKEFSRVGKKKIYLKIDAENKVLFDVTHVRSNSADLLIFRTRNLSGTEFNNNATGKLIEIWQKLTGNYKGAIEIVYIISFDENTDKQRNAINELNLDINDQLAMIWQHQDN